MAMAVAPTTSDRPVPDARPILAVALAKLGSMSTARFRQSRNVQLAGCTAIAKVELRSPEEATKLVNAGPFDAIVSAMKRFPGDAELCQRGLEALTSLSVASASAGSGWRHLMQAGVCETVSASLADYKDSQPIQFAGCSVVASLVAPANPAPGTSAEDIKSDEAAHEAVRTKLLELDVCAAVVAALRGHTQDVEMHQLGIKALATLAMSGTAATQQLVQAKAGDVVIQGMRSAPEDAFLQRDGCVVLACICHAGDIRMGELLDAGIVEAVCAAMLAFPADHVVQRCGLACMPEVLQKCEGAAKSAAVIAGAPSAMIVAMRSALENAALQRAGIFSVTLLVGEPQVGLTEAFVDAGALEAILHAMWTHDADLELQRKSCSALLGLVSDCSSAAVKLAQAGAALVLIRALAGPSSADVAVQRDGCGLLDIICRVDVDSARQAVERGVCEAVCFALYTFREDVALQGRGCSVVAGLVVESSANAWDRLSKAGAQEAVLVAMRAYPADAHTQRSGCRALVGFLLASLKESPAAASLLMETGAGTAIVQAMRSFPTDRDVQCDGCTAVALLAAHASPEGRQRFAKDVAYLVPAGMLALPEDRGVQLAGSKAIVSIFHLSSSDKVKPSQADSGPLLLKADVCAAVVSSMTLFAGDSEMQRELCKAMSCLARSGASAPRLLRDAGALDACLLAMRHFSTDLDVQASCCGTLAELSSDDASADVKRRLVSAGVCELLVGAMNEFPRDLETTRSCCKAALHLAGCEAGPSALVKAGAPGALRTALHVCPDDHLVQSCGAVALAALLQVEIGEAPEQRKQRHDPENCEAVFRAVVACPQDRDLRLAVCKVAEHLASIVDQGDLQPQLTRGNATTATARTAATCWAVLSAMKDLPRDREVQFHGCWAIRLHASRGTAARRGWVEAGACEAALASMATFPHDVEVQWASCSALATLSMGDVEGRRRLMDAGASGAVLAALRKLPWVAEGPAAASARLTTASGCRYPRLPTDGIQSWVYTESAPRSK